MPTMTEYTFAEFLRDPSRIDPFLAGYLECALWLFTDEDGMPLDSEYDFSDFSEAALASSRKDCELFREKAGSLLAPENWGKPIDYAGHDFWLTRNGHGAGFWDREPDQTIHGQTLTNLSKQFREADLYLGDDGKIEVM